MRNRLLKEIFVLLVLLSLTAIAQAADNIAIPVSCSIPAVPGINAPLVEKEKTVKTEDMTVAEEETNQKETKSPANIQEEDNQEIVLAEGKTATVVVQTIYSR